MLYATAIPVPAESSRNDESARPRDDRALTILTICGTLTMLPPSTMANPSAFETA